MYTLKHIDDSKKETLQAVTAVTFDHETSNLVGHGTDGDKHYTGGVAYVMNDNGKTVGMYNLRKP